MRYALLIAALMGISGCISTEATRLGSGAAYAPVDRDHVAVYRNADSVGAPYVEVALINASGDYMTSPKLMNEFAREKAGKLGANGIILDSVTEPSTGAKIASFFFLATADRVGKVIAIRVNPQKSDEVGTVAEALAKDRKRSSSGATQTPNRP